MYITENSVSESPIKYEILLSKTVEIPEATRGKKFSLPLDKMLHTLSQKKMHGEESVVGSACIAFRCENPNVCPTISYRLNYLFLTGD